MGFDFTLGKPAPQYDVPHPSEVFSPWLWPPGRDVRVRNPHAGGVEKGEIMVRKRWGKQAPSIV